MAISKETKSDIGIAFVAAALWGFVQDLMKKFMDTGSVEVIGHVVKKATEESRGELLAFILKDVAVHSPEGKMASENFMKHQALRQTESGKSYSTTIPKERYQPGDEDKMVSLLTKLFKALDGTSEKTPEAAEKELKLRLEAFVVLGNMDDEKFDTTLEFLNHDALIQWIKKAFGYIGIGLKATGEFLKPHNLKLREWMDAHERKMGRKVRI